MSEGHTVPHMHTDISGLPTSSSTYTETYCRCRHTLSKHNCVVIPTHKSPNIFTCTCTKADGYTFK